ncbi:metal-dependent hydrolase family protein [Nocardioides nitrophenolicus]|uniref:metal-dependent hydrolase family protein n=1 Tax=Nocardioides nitrophenolicus TaxID=60489 RepID=UPI00196212D5|nr:amidohydrolase family protein [Nocardioides nitrophenolicus]MBM7520431.1 imidazolonepropionase-like amidohydrolase [Nocardioides nitrophenolicus]
MTSTLLRGGHVLVGDGTAPVRADVLVAEGRVAAVGLDLPAPAPAGGVDVLDVSGAVVAPGLVDCHVHLVFDGMDSQRLQAEPFSLQYFQAARAMAATLAAGVTTVRDAGGADLGMKVAQERGLLPGPRLRTAVSVLSPTGGHADGWTVHGDDVRLLVPHPGRPACVVDGVEGMRLRVRELARAGADVIKVCASGGVMSTRDDPHHPQFSADELAVCVAEAADHGLGVMAHAHSAEGIHRALRAGVRSIEHGVYLDDEGIELLLDRGAWLVPTLLAPVALVESIDAGMRVPPEVEDKARRIADGHLAAVARAYDAGVRIALGTDSGVFAHGQNHRELGLLAEAGMRPAEVLATSRSGAELLGLDDVGTVTAGARADLVVLDGDWADLGRFAENLRLVLQDGVVR